MSAIIIPRRHLAQPQGRVEINWNHKSTSALRAAFVPTGSAVLEAVSGLISTSNAGVPTVRPEGITLGMSSSAPTAVFNSTFGMPQLGVSLLVIARARVEDFDHGCLLKIGDSTTGYGIGLGYTDFDGASAEQRILGLYENVAWRNPFPVLDVSAGPWAACMTTDPIGAGAGAIYSPGRGRGTWAPGAAPITPNGMTYVGGYKTSRYPLEQEFLIAFAFARVVGDAEVDELYSAPWQLFKADPIRIYSLPSGAITLGTPRFLRVTSSGFGVELDLS